MNKKLEEGIGDVFSFGSPSPPRGQILDQTAALKRIVQQIAGSTIPQKQGEAFIINSIEKINKLPFFSKSVSIHQRVLNFIEELKNGGKLPSNFQPSAQDMDQLKNAVECVEEGVLNALFPLRADAPKPQDLLAKDRKKDRKEALVQAIAKIESEKEPPGVNRYRHYKGLLISLRLYSLDWLANYAKQHGLQT